MQVPLFLHGDRLQRFTRFCNPGKQARQHPHTGTDGSGCTAFRGIKGKHTNNGRDNDDDNNNNDDTNRPAASLGLDPALPGNPST